MEEIIIRANSFAEARKLLAKRFKKTGIPIRIGESSVYRFVQMENLVTTQKDIDYERAEKKFNKSSRFL